MFSAYVKFSMILFSMIFDTGSQFMSSPVWFCLELNSKRSCSPCFALQIPHCSHPFFDGPVDVFAAIICLKCQVQCAFKNLRASYKSVAYIFLNRLFLIESSTFPIYCNTKISADTYQRPAHAQLRQGDRNCRELAILYSLIFDRTLTWWRFAMIMCNYLCNITGPRGVWGALAGAL